MHSDQNGDKTPESGALVKPYLIRAIYQWTLDNGYTPHVLIKAETDDVVVPRQYVDNGLITLNVHPSSVAGLELGDDFIGFSARFSGKSMEIMAPLSAVTAIFSRETGQGIAFQDDHHGVTLPLASNMDPSRTNTDSTEKSKVGSKPKAKSSPRLKLVE